jgi:hypothetical protein
MISTICYVIAIAALINAARLKINQVKAERRAEELRERALVVGTLSRFPK